MEILRLLKRHLLALCVGMLAASHVAYIAVLQRGIDDPTTIGVLIAGTVMKDAAGRWRNDVKAATAHRTPRRYAYFNASLAPTLEKWKRNALQ